jgi:hypothetical protein
VSGIKKDFDEGGLTIWDSDAFTKRESASEELYIRQEERAKYVQNSDLQWHTNTHSTCTTWRRHTREYMERH